MDAVTGKFNGSGRNFRSSLSKSPLLGLRHTAYSNAVLQEIQTPESFKPRLRHYQPARSWDHPGVFHGGLEKAKLQWHASDFSLHRSKS